MSNKKRDKDLIYKILLEIEKSDVYKVVDSKYLKKSELLNEYDIGEIEYHILLLKSADFIDLVIKETKFSGEFNKLGTHYIMGMTWEGHNYLDECKKSKNSIPAMSSTAF